MLKRCCALLAILFIALLPLVAQNTPATNDAYKPVLDRLQSISVITLADWRTHIGDLPHGEDAALNDSAWQAIKLPTKSEDNWKTGSQWIRTTITVPEKLNGYDLRGARLDLDVAVTSDEAIQISSFSNGSLIGRTDEDTQLPITLTTNAQPGQKFVVAIRVVGNKVNTGVRRAQLLVTAAQNRPDAGMLRTELLCARPMIAAYTDGKPAREQILDAAVKAIDLGALDKSDQNAFDASLKNSRAELEKLRPYLNQFAIRATGNSHIDMAWLWPETETVEVVRNTFASALQLMREYPDLTFTMAQAQAYKWMEDKYPDIFKEIQQRVKEGRWEIVGGMWVEPDLNLPDGESLVRQILYGKRYFQQKFGVDVKIGWNPDTFGYNWQLPQIYKRSGMDYFVTQKIYWNETTKFPHKLFWWQAPDGSKLLTYFPHDYANTVEPVRMATDMSVYGPAMFKADAGTNKLPAGELEMMHLFGVGDHGGGPTRRDLDVATDLRKPGTVYPQLKFGTALGYFDDLNKRVADLNVPTWNDELYLEYHRAVQTTQAATKRGNRKSEVLMLNAEKLASIGTLFGAKYPQADFEGAWKQVLFNQFHDILPGSGIAVNYVDAAEKYEHVRRVASDSIHESITDLAAHVNTPATSVLVFNPLSWTRTELVEVEAQLPTAAKYVTATGPDNKPMAAEVLSTDAATNRTRVRLLATDIPALGYKLVKLTALSAPKSPRLDVSVTNVTDLKASADSLENEFFRVAIDPKTGCITSLFDKRSKTEALAAAVAGDGAPAANTDGKPCGNLLQVFTDKPKRWDAWNIDADFIKQHTDLMQADEVKLVENTPLRAVIRVSKHYKDSKFTQDITMYPAVPRVDVKMTADNWGVEKHVMLKVAFPLSATNEKATFEIPYGSIQRPTTRRTPEEQAKFEVPALRWADLSDAAHGFSLLNESKYGYDAKDNVLRLSLLRAPIWPDPHADEGHHEFTYSLYPHGQTWKEAMTVRRGYELNEPLIAVAVQPHTGPLPATQSFFSADADNVVITSIKKEEDSDAISLRLYEWAGRKADVKLSIPAGMKIAAETNLMEKAAAETATASTTITINPYEIRTVRLVKTK